MKGFALVEFIILTTIPLCTIVLFIGLGGIHYSSLREGRHTGFVTAIEQEGYFFPNYNVYVKTDNSSSQEDIYCVHRDNKALADTLKNASIKRQLITITFNGVRGWGYGLCHTQEIKAVTIDR